MGIPVGNQSFRRNSTSAPLVSAIRTDEYLSIILFACEFVISECTVLTDISSDFTCLKEQVGFLQPRKLWKNLRKRSPHKSGSWHTCTQVLVERMFLRYLDHIFALNSVARSPPACPDGKMYTSGLHGIGLWHSSDREYSRDLWLNRND